VISRGDTAETIEINLISRAEQQISRMRPSNLTTNPPLKIRCPSEAKAVTLRAAAQRRPVSGVIVLTGLRISFAASDEELTKADRIFVARQSFVEEAAA
jgi:hypothetical protein